jgi:hypothetical protein
MSHELLTRTMEGRAVKRVAVSVRDGEFNYAFD